MKKIIILILCVLFTGSVFAAELCIEVPTDKVDRAKTGMCARYNYDPNTDGTQIRFIRQQIVNFIRENVVAYEYEQDKNNISRTFTLPAAEEE